MPSRRPLLLADGKPADTISEYTLIPCQIGDHQELGLFFVVNLAPDTPLILGLPWLRRHNPVIDWAALTLTFSSNYCCKFCLPKDLLSCQAVIIPDKIRPLEIAVPGEPDVIHIQTISPKAKHKPYKPPSVEDCSEDDLESTTKPSNAKNLTVEETLTPGQDHYTTYSIYKTSNPTHQARMIPTPYQTKPAKAVIIGGSRQTSKKPAKNIELPPLSVRPPQLINNEQSSCDRPNMEDIRLLGATGFLQFCRQPGVQATRLTWDELERVTVHTNDKPPEILEIPNLPEDDFKAILTGEGNWPHLRALFPENELKDFVDECFIPDTLARARIQDSDIEKFLKGKPEQTPEDIAKRLPAWLVDLKTAFMPKRAEELAPHRAWDHKIELLPGKEPPYFRNRPMSPAELKVVRKWLDDNLAKGYIRQSHARCAAPLLLAAKPGGGVRICQDYRGLNNITIKNRYPLPLIRETLDSLSNAKIFTKLDVIAAFNKLRIAEGHEWKTAFITRFGLFETLVTPFGLCNAPASFQNYINNALWDLLDKTCTAYLDDIIIYSQDIKEHRQQVRDVVQRLDDAGLQIDIDKCEFETTRVKYLGLIIAPGSIGMDPEKVKAITSWRIPSCIKDVQRFLGFANFYRRFIKDFSKICTPLNSLLRKGIAWKWDNKQDEAFEELKCAFISAPVLAMFDYTRKTVLETDASDWACGGVLSQYNNDNVLQPVAYFSAKHSAQECNYEIYDKELLAIIKSLEEWRPELLGVQEPVEIITDHKNLEYFTTTKVLNQRQVRWSEFLSQFDFRIIYRPGSRAVRPDALSRKSEDRPDKSNPDDDRIKNRERIILPREVLDEKVLEDLTGEINTSNENHLHARPIDIILPEMDRPIDELIDRSYIRSQTAQTMLTALRDPAIRNWPKVIRKDLRISMTDCKVIRERIYYRDKLYIPPDTELQTQIIYRAHSTGPAGHPVTSTIPCMVRYFN